MVEMHCQACGNAFQGTAWMKFCSECWDTVKTATTPAAESNHPALVYEREHPSPTVATKGDLFVGLEALSRCHSMLASLPEAEAVSEPFLFSSQHSCEHEFRDEIMSTCIKCGIFKEQFLYSVQVKPQTRLDGKKAQ